MRIAVNPEVVEDAPWVVGFMHGAPKMSAWKSINQDASATPPHVQVEKISWVGGLPAAGNFELVGVSPQLYYVDVGVV